MSNKNYIDPFLWTPVKIDDSLGRYAKSITPTTVADDSRREAVATTRAERYYLLSCARSILVAAGVRGELKYPHNYHRTAKCKFIRHNADYVSVHFDREHQSAFYSGLVSCGSVWACPVCTAKVQERRRDEVASLIDYTYTNQLQPIMVTLTFPHKSWHKLAKLLAQLAKALQRLRAGQPWERFKVRWGLEGLVRSLEVMHGANGWHPHVHEIWLVKKDTNANEIQKDILKLWKSACTRAGLLKAKQLQDFEVRAVDVRGNISSSDYLLKQDDSRYWGADREITKTSIKTGRSKGLHPFGLLAQAGEGDRRAGRLYLAYCIAFKGRRQLLWSPGLKAKVGVLDLTDEAIAEESREAADLLGSLSDADWQKVRGANARAQVLQAAEHGGWVAVQMLLLSLAQAFVLVCPADSTVKT